ncbi:MAG: hypothetical protein ACTHK8_00990 [Ginsengibacter sp.]
MGKIFRVFILALFFSLAISACRKANKEMPFMNSATIVAPDPRMGMCTGGIFIKIDSHPNPNDLQNGYFDIDSMPPSFKIDTYPIRVEIDLKISSKCFGNYVVINRIKEIQ